MKQFVAENSSKTALVLFFFISSLGCITQSFAQTADSITAAKIIEKHIAAMGGKAKLATMKSLYQKTSVTMPLMGVVMVIKTWIVDKVGKREETSSPMEEGKEIKVIIKEKSWIASRRIGNAEGRTEKWLFNFDVSTTNALFNYKEKGFTATYMGEEDISGTWENPVFIDGTFYKIKLTHDDSTGYAEVIYFIDSKTYYIGRIVKKIPNLLTEEMSFAGYVKTANGYLYPKIIQIKSGERGGLLTTTTDEYEVNIPIDKNRFEKPY